MHNEVRGQDAAWRPLRVRADCPKGSDQLCSEQPIGQLVSQEKRQHPTWKPAGHGLLTQCPEASYGF